MTYIYANTIYQESAFHLRPHHDIKFRPAYMQVSIAITQLRLNGFGLFFHAGRRGVCPAFQAREIQFSRGYVVTHPLVKDTYLTTNRVPLGLPTNAG